MARASKKSIKSASIKVRGIVQGVGFRPFVYGLAVVHNLQGQVYNTSEDVRIEVEGEGEAVERFARELVTKAPPLAHIETVNIEYKSPCNYRKFRILKSRAQEGKYQLISPDIATCQSCLDELLNPEDRRYRYPFTNCTNCGPRFTIIQDMPYDRPKTTMCSFQMCSHCQAEYDNPLDRRFHAQPNACPKCGPQVELVDNLGNLVTQSNPIATASQFLREGKILAIKGLGGFLLACDATSDTVIKTLRQRKKRASKPFAVMVADKDEVKKHCHVSLEEEALLTSPQSPIVLMKWKERSSISTEVAPNLQFLGVMLPYTPLHHLLLRDTGLPLVMTSGNLSEEPIARDNDEALRRLSGIADYFLIHNRDIYSRYDDSVAIVEKGISQVIRRARSYAPYPTILPFKTKQVLGCGAEEKNTFCLIKDNYAFLSQHIGDMENIETLEHFNSTVALYKRLFRVDPEIIAHDFHPDYLSTKYARELGESGVKLVPVQHHHAHIASCMADNGLESKVIGVAFDGTGMGADGKIWGGEFLVADYHNYERVGHLEYLPLPGGDASIKRPYRTAIGYILTLLGKDALNYDLPVIRQTDDIEIDVIEHQIKKGINTPFTSSMGRLFDVVSALLNIRGEINYEGQAAVELEMAAYEEDYVHIQDSYPYRIVEDEEIRVIRLKDVLTAIIEDLKHDMSTGMISIKFHNTVVRIIDEMCSLITDKTGITQVALSGGVFQNRILVKKTINLLESSGFQVFTHRQVPCNDGGISLGQAVVGNFVI